ncbi:MAG: FAD-binding protein, partial [Muribaculaceae bacterium]|nr:FAD-binding protein [Muribaculaceae bacterium]
MLKDISLRVIPDIAYENERLAQQLARELKIDRKRIKRVDLVKRSIDARQRQVMVNLNLRVHVDEIDETIVDFEPTVYPDVSDKPQVIVVGAGPAGLFAALQLIEKGYKPIVLERGKDVDSRRKDMAKISREQKVDPESNYCFGEGGAGAYSDGKLYTRSKKRGSVDRVLQIFVEHGAHREILVDAHPHIGTDRLPGVIKAIRETIIKAGGEVHFETKMSKLIIEGKRVVGVETSDGCKFEGPVILATGHSARDVYKMLDRSGIAMSPKGIAVGVRLEHPQKTIARIQYHSPQGRGKDLPAAEY